MSVLDDVLREEHERASRVIAAMQAELGALPKGYISRKLIHGRPAYYLQWREKEKIKSRHISSSELPELTKSVNRRKQLEQSIRALRRNIWKIEKVLK